MAHDSGLEALGLEHDFGEGRGLARLDLHVEAGEVVGLLGPNGSGKSTALALLSGMLPIGAARGSLWVDQKQVPLNSRDYRAALGVVFQQPSLDRKLSARENLVLSMRSHGFSGAASAARAQDLLLREGLEERADDLVDDLSGGMRRRVDLIRALAHHPSLLLMDEPSTGLDERSFRGLWSSLASLRKAGQLSVLVATHKAAEAARCDRLLILHGGRVVASGAPAQLVDSLKSDVLELKPGAPDQLESLVQRLRDELKLEARVVDGCLEVPCQEGPRVLVQVIERMGQGSFESVSVRRPSLADVFFELSGARLDDSDADDRSRTKRSRKRRKGKAA